MHMNDARLKFRCHIALCLYELETEVVIIIVIIIIIIIIIANWQVIDVGEQNGLRFPREFALLVKQLLYFDR